MLYHHDGVACLLPVSTSLHNSELEIQRQVIVSKCVRASRTQTLQGLESSQCARISSNVTQDCVVINYPIPGTLKNLASSPIE